jgi:hypothetical protein
MRQNRQIAGAVAVAAVMTVAGAAPADEINVSRIATGTFTPITFSSYANKPTVNGAAISYFVMATGAVDTETGAHFATAPWTASLSPAPTYPDLLRQTVNAPYDQGGAHFEYAAAAARQARVSMSVVPPKTIDAATFVKGAASAGSAVTYRVRIAHTSASALDYFLDLAVPVQKLTVQPAYNLCCSGDSNGGTYNYLRPEEAQARTEADVYVDGLPVWSSASTYLYPGGATGSPFDKAQADWDKGASPTDTRLYLGRLSQGQVMTVTLEARSDVKAKSPCGIESPGSSFSKTYTIHCLELRESVRMNGGANGAPVAFTVYSKAPQ